MSTGYRIGPLCGEMKSCSVSLNFVEVVENLVFRLVVLSRLLPGGNYCEHKYHAS